jgi:Uma2 family endonuclease
MSLAAARCAPATPARGWIGVSRAFVAASENPDVAPALDIWRQMTVAERRMFIDALPVSVTEEEREAEEEEGDDHRETCSGAVDALRGFWERTGRRAYVSSNLVTYYPAEKRFAPDLLVVFDVGGHRRRRWVVADEGKGLDFALEVLDRGAPKKDLEDNVVRYARLGIPEYFIADLRNAALLGYRLPRHGARKYVRVPPQRGRVPSVTLGLDVGLDAHGVRFSIGNAPLLESAELLVQVERELLLSRERVALEQRHLEEERRLREAAEAELAILKAKLLAKPGPRRKR